MSRENVEFVRRAVEAWNAGAMDRLSEFYAPDAIVRGLDGWPEPGPYFGWEEIRRSFERIREPWKTDSIEIVGAIRDAGDRVVTRWRWRVEGQGPPSEMEFTVVLTIRAGKIHYHEYFWNHVEALEALGLRE